MAPIRTAEGGNSGQRRRMRVQTSQAMVRISGSSTSTAASSPHSGTRTSVRSTPSTKPAAKTAAT